MYVHLVFSYEKSIVLMLCSLLARVVGWCVERTHHDDNFVIIFDDTVKSTILQFEIRLL